MKNALGKRIAVLEAQVSVPAQQVIGVRSINPPPLAGWLNDREGLVRVFYGRRSREHEYMTVGAFWERYPHGVLIGIGYADTFHRIQADALRRLSVVGNVQEPPAQQYDLGMEDLYCQYVTVREIEGPLTAPTVRVYCGCSENHPR